MESDFLALAIRAQEGCSRSVGWREGEGIPVSLEVWLRVDGALFGGYILSSRPRPCSIEFGTNIGGLFRSSL